MSVEEGLVERIEEQAKEIEKLRALLILCDGRCGSLHHAAADRHESGEPCPVEARIERALRGKEKAT